MNKVKLFSWPVAFVCTLVLIDIPDATAAPFVICSTAAGAINVRNKRCRRGETKLNNLSLLTGPVGATGVTGPTGASGSQGPEGEAGNLRIYGDGSAGARVVAGDETLFDTNLQYTNFTINANTTLTVESGTVIRCTGTFTNNGTISVLQGTSGGAIEVNTAFDSNGYPAYADAEPGIAFRTAQAGEFGSSAAVRHGGRGGRGLSEFQARWMLKPGHFGGGSGAGNQLGGFGGRGGGTLTVLAQTAIVNSGSGTISANGLAGGTGAGGGAGGIVILASPGSITNNGTINAIGGAGGASDIDAGGGGGGTGGIINLLSPAVSPVGGGTVNVSGGTGGPSSLAVSGTLRQGGGGGGACGGDDGGGDGGNVAAGSAVSPGGAGGSGDASVTQIDPTSLF